ncbi:hypothetical protein VNO78_07484 [Psophocarpus tetragonolobus]|uniref:Uncharacterized protein n=1 Tax=Psophocarpus tetragonolobus TaxID=3891 RepID=A0AAN9T3A9_PSOTE
MLSKLKMRGVVGELLLFLPFLYAKPQVDSPFVGWKRQHLNGVGRKFKSKLHVRGFDSYGFNWYSGWIKDKDFLFMRFQVGFLFGFHFDVWPGWKVVVLLRRRGSFYFNCYNLYGTTTQALFRRHSLKFSLEEDEEFLLLIFLYSLDARVKGYFLLFFIPSGHSLLNCTTPSRVLMSIGKGLYGCAIVDSTTRPRTSKLRELSDG